MTSGDKKIYHSTGADPENPERGGEETDDAVLRHSGSICDQTLRLNVKNFSKIQEKKGGRGPLAPPPPPPPLKSAPVPCS